MTAQQIAYLIYFLSMSIVAPILWATTVPVLVTLVKAKQWMLALMIAIVIVWSGVVWHTKFVVPIAYNLPYTMPSVWDWFASILVIPATIIAVIFLKRELQKVREQKKENN